MEKPTDEEILAMDNVPVKTAAAYLGVSYLHVYGILQDQHCPYGTAHKEKSNWTYQISPGLLEAYQRGTLQICYGCKKNKL
jgi:hypothetical protein